MKNTFLKIIMPEQILFALPLAYIGMLLAGKPEIETWLWVTIGLISVKTANACFRKAICKGRMIPVKFTSEKVSQEANLSALWFSGITASALLVLSAYMLNELCFYISIISVIMLILYPLIKRINSTSSYYAGFIEIVAPAGGFLAITGRFELTPFVPGLAVLFWIVGFDIVYAVARMGFKNKKKYFSIPSKFGLKKSLMISSFLYLLSISTLIITGITTSRGLPFWISIITLAIIFFNQQRIARSHEIEITAIEFFQINNLISPILFAGIYIDVLFS